MNPVNSFDISAQPGFAVRKPPDRFKEIKFRIMPRAIRTLIPVLLLFILLQACRREPEGLSVSFVGDIIMHIPVKTCARLNDLPSGTAGESANNAGFDYLFERIAPRLRAADITLGNLEIGRAHV